MSRHAVFLLLSLAAGAAAAGLGPDAGAAARAESPDEQVARATRLIAGAAGKPALERAQAYVLRAIGHHRARRFEPALADARAAIAADPAHYSARVIEGQALSGLGRCPDALASLGKALALAPERERCLIFMSEADVRRACGDPAARVHGSLRKAVACAEAASLPAQAAAARGRLAAYLCADGRYDEGAAEHARALEAAPGDRQTRLAMGLCLQRAGRVAAARAAYDAGLAAPERGAKTLDLGHATAVRPEDSLIRLTAYSRRASLRLSDGDASGAMDDAAAGLALVEEMAPGRLERASREEVAALYLLRSRLWKSRGEATFASEDAREACRWTPCGGKKALQ